MAGYVISGGRALYVYTATNGTTPSVGTTPVFTATDQIDTDVAFDDQGVATLTVNQIQDDEAFNTFIEAYAKPTASSAGTPEDITFEDGVSMLGASSAGQALYVIVKGGVVTGSGTSVGKRKAFHMFAVAQKTSGSWNQSGNVYNKPTLSFVAQAVETPITIAGTYFASVVAATSPAAQLLNNTSRKFGAVFFG
jgi:hypothetical protein